MPTGVGAFGNGGGSGTPGIGAETLVPKDAGKGGGGGGKATFSGTGVPGAINRWLELSLLRGVGSDGASSVGKSAGIGAGFAVGVETGVPAVGSLGVS